MRRSEDHHHTAEQVARYVQVALTIADEIGLADADRAVLLPVIVTQLGSKQIFYEQPQPIPHGLLDGIRRA